MLPADQSAVTVSAEGRFLDNQPGQDRAASLDLVISGARGSNYQIDTPLAVLGELYPNPKEQGLVPSGVSPQKPPEVLFSEPIVPLLVNSEPQLDPEYVAMASEPPSVEPALPELASLTPLSIQEIRPDQLRGLSSQDFELLGPDQVQALSSNQIAALKPEQLLVILPQLTPTQRTAVTNRQLLAMQEILKF